MLEPYFALIKEYPLVAAPLLGIIPALFWLWFWLKEDTHPEPAKMLTLSFLGGMLAVVLVLWPESFVLHHFQDRTYLSFLLWASLEELFKFAIVYLIALQFKVNNEPVDSIIYLIVGALGFVALENTFFIIDLIHSGDIYGVFITGSMRFIGASLLHIMSSATIGICMALAFYKSCEAKWLYTTIGIIIAIILHTSFNIYIMSDVNSNILLTFGIVWIGIIALLLAFEKIKHLKTSKFDELRR